MATTLIVTGCCDPPRRLSRSVQLIDPWPVKGASATLGHSRALRRPHVGGDQLGYRAGQLLG